MTLRIQPWVRHTVPLLLLSGALVFLARDLEGALTAQNPQASPADVMQRILGSAEEAVGDALFLKADSYFHGGAAEHGPGCDPTKEGIIEEAGHDQQAQAPASDWIAAVNRQRLIHEHYHLEGAKKREMLPFLAWSTQLDPHNVEAVLTAAFWLGGEFKRPNEALKILQKGLQDNPGSWEIAVALGDYFFKQRNEFKQSLRYYRQAVALLTGPGPYASEGDTLESDKAANMSPSSVNRTLGTRSVNSVSTAADRQHLFYYLAESYDRTGDKSNALLSYQKALAENPTGAETAIRQSIRKKISDLST